MKFFALASLCAPALAASTSTSTSPVSKAVDLLASLQAKVIKEGEASQKLYQEFSEWCEDRARTLSHDIKVGSAEAETLKASVASSLATEQEMAAKIEELTAGIAADEADLKAAGVIRDKETKDFKAEEAELTETISMLRRAIAILEREMAKKVEGSFVQVKDAKSLAAALSSMVEASVFSASDAKRLSAVLAQTSSGEGDADSEGEQADLKALGAPAAEIYESKSGGIVETLEKLLDTAEEHLAEARKVETTNLNNYEMLKQSLEDEIKFANKDLAEAKKTATTAAEAKATAEGDLTATSKDLEADTKTKADLHEECLSKAQDYEQETKSRSEELEALAKAKAAVEEATNGAASLSYGTSFLQTVSTLSSRSDLAIFEVVRTVRDLARRDDSKALSLLSQRLSAVVERSSVAGKADAFAKVKDLISQLITKLEEDAAADATHKAYCDKELKETTEKKAEKTAEVEKLTTKVDQMTTKSAQLKEEVAALQKTLASVAASKAEMDKIRASEKELYTQSKADLEQGLEGVKLALKILSEYYAKDTAHEAATGEGTSIIGLLEVVESDFAKNLAEIEAAEESAAADYDKDTKETEVLVASKQQDAAYKAKEAASLDRESSALSSDLANAQAELDAILEYLSKIEGQCTEKAETYDERKSRRAAEIEGLKQALETLETEVAFVQRRTLRHRKFTQGQSL